jgi:hypothetical protein
MIRDTIKNHSDFIAGENDPTARCAFFLVRAKPAKYPDDARFGLIVTKKTFKQIYEELDSTPPKTKWIRRIAKVTMRSELTVRMWLNGRQTPEPLVQKIIAKELGVEVNELFPKD